MPEVSLQPRNPPQNFKDTSTSVMSPDLSRNEESTRLGVSASSFLRVQALDYVYLGSLPIIQKIRSTGFMASASAL